VSPADGAITYVGRVQGSHLEQVKGVRYSLKLFFGALHDILSSTDGRKDELALSSRLSFNDTFESGE
jgi:phosphatidylserine decarboxylase